MAMQEDSDGKKTLSKKERKKLKKEKKETERKRNAETENLVVAEAAPAKDVSKAVQADSGDGEEIHKKEKKKLKKKKKRSRTEETSTAGVEADAEQAATSDAEVISDSCVGEEIQKKEKKKSKKEKKRSRNEATSTADVEADAERKKLKKPKKKKKRSDDDTKKAAATSNNSNGSARPLVESSALDPNDTTRDYDGDDEHQTTLLLFYQYVQPVWTEKVYKQVLKQVEEIGTTIGVNGRMRVAREGLNCTLSGSCDAVKAFCDALRRWKPREFNQTEFKLTHHCKKQEAFRNLKIMRVAELVNYGLEQHCAASSSASANSAASVLQDYSGTHLEPQDYHAKLGQTDTVVIDVRNHYEAAIGRFSPPGAQFLNPKMRKSTEFPLWLDEPKTREQLKGKQVLMYCTGGIRCERASALLKYKMDTDEATKDLGITGVYQLQGGIDKYFKEFPAGGYWKGKNYTFDKRHAHEPTKTITSFSGAAATVLPAAEPLSKCQACHKPWDKYRGKRRCPTCGVPSLICKECYQADQNGSCPLDTTARCELCVEQDVRSKKQLRDAEKKNMAAYEERLQFQQTKQASFKKAAPKAAPAASSAAIVGTRLLLKNMCKTTMTDEALLAHLPGITHVVWNMKQGVFMGQAWVEMETKEAAMAAVARSGQPLLDRNLYIEYQAAGGKDLWPPPRSAVGQY